jgi:hypothetical protein
MADIKIKYGTALSSFGATTALDSLASSSPNTAGWTTAGQDNTSNLYLDVLISAKFTTSSSTLTGGKSIKVYAYATPDNSANFSAGWPDLFTSGTEGTVGLASVYDEEQRDAGMRLLWAGVVDTGGTNEVFVMPPTSLAQAFGGVVPAYWALWVVQDTGQALNNGGNAIYGLPILAQSV